MYHIFRIQSIIYSFLVILMMSLGLSSTLANAAVTNIYATNLTTGLGGASGFGENTLTANDDGSSAFIDVYSVFPTGFNFFGVNYSGFYVNNNGNITFSATQSTFTPSAITGVTSNPIIAPYFADVDTTGGATTPTVGGTSTGTNLVYWDLDTVNKVITITWDDVGYYNSAINKLNAFQLRIVNTGGGNFTLDYLYENIDWTTGNASGGTNGLGGTVARAGWSSGNGTDFYEFPESGIEAQMLALDTLAPRTFTVVDGYVQVIPILTLPTDIYVSAQDISGTPASNNLITQFLSDAVANDAIDGTLIPTNNAPAVFPVGVTTVTFTITNSTAKTVTGTATVTVGTQQQAQAITSPINGATLIGTSQTFTWTDTGASSYRLLIGATFGGAGFFDSYALPAGTTSVTATGLPDKGIPVYVRLYAWTGGAWLRTDHLYVGANKPIATVTTPANGTTLAATSQTFSWTDTGADKYFLMVGNFAVGGGDLYSSGLLVAGTTSVTINGLPNDGSTVYVRLYTWGNGAWQTSDTSYIAMPNTANVNNITNGATLTGTTQTFTWVDTGASSYYFIVGTALGLGDIHQSGNLAAGTTSANVTGLPVGGVPVYVRLYSWGNGSWNTSNTTYTSAP